MRKAEEITYFCVQKFNTSCKNLTLTNLFEFPSNLNATGQLLKSVRKQYDKSNGFRRLVTISVLHSVFAEESLISQMLYIYQIQTNLSYGF